MDGFDFDTSSPANDSFGSFGSNQGGQSMDFDSPAPPSYQSGGQDDFGFGESNSASFGDFGSGSGSQPQASGSFGFDEAPASPAPASGSFDFGEAPQANADMGSFDQYGSGSGSAPSNDFGFDSQPAESGSFTQESEYAPQPTEESSEAQQEESQDVFSGMRSSFTGGNSEVMREYEAEHNKFLEEKADEERKKHQKALEKAKEEIANFYSEREKKVESSREQNRESQKASTLSKPADDKQAWANLSELINWDGSSKEGSANTDRMRNILMDMKHAA